MTVAGHRNYCIYTDEAEFLWLERFGALREATGYELEYAYDEDPEHRAYWDELFPTVNDRQVIADINVLESLRRHGDDGSAERTVDHFAYFPDAISAQRFSVWLRQQGYQVESCKPTDDGRYGVTFSHRGTVLLNDISEHTIALRNQADAMQGEYDGWGTSVCKPED